MSTTKSVCGRHRPVYNWVLEGLQLDVQSFANTNAVCNQLNDYTIHGVCFYQTGTSIMFDFAEKRDLKEFGTCLTKVSHLYIYFFYLARNTTENTEAVSIRVMQIGIE